MYHIQVEFLAKHFVFLYRPEDDVLNLALSLIQYNKVISVFLIIILLKILLKNMVQVLQTNHAKFL